MVGKRHTLPKSITNPIMDKKYSMKLSHCMRSIGGFLPPFSNRSSPASSYSNLLCCSIINQTGSSLESFDFLEPEN
ncbi:hypothetical protein BpHYR1_054207 [Brachionus plicatilis]|uniref:Uncharacterized protein n=1 Tax=Brachionus plicatilis TaxID=10195 RepID=A0A3M7RJ37_BRAPC|nr:hypothetical protein BpHYR1_054207 [Brachionus plicatilis]